MHLINNKKVRLYYDVIEVFKILEKQYSLMSFPLYIYVYFNSKLDDKNELVLNSEDEFNTFYNEVKLELSDNQLKELNNIQKPVEDIMSAEEKYHNKKILKKLKNKIQLENEKNKKKKEIKIISNNKLLLFNCFNGIIMHAGLQDINRIEKAVEFNKFKNKKNIKIYDYYNKIYILDFEIVLDMIKELKENFYNILEKKQRIYTKIDNIRSMNELSTISWDKEI